LKAPLISQTDGVYQYIRQLYAADHIAKLEESNDNNQHTNEIVKLSVDYHIMNSKTSFVVVDETEHSSLSSLPVPVNVPHYTGARHMVGGMRGGGGGSAPRRRLHTSSSSGASPLLGRVISDSSYSPSSGPGKTALPPSPPEDVHYNLFDEEDDGAGETGNDSIVFDQRAEILHQQDASLDALSNHVNKLNLISSIIHEELNDRNVLLDSLDNDMVDRNAPVQFRRKKEEAPASSVWGFFASKPSVPGNTAVKTSTEKEGKDLDALLNYKSADGSFIKNEDSLVLSDLSSDKISSFAKSHNFSEELTFNLFVLKIYKNDGSKKYVMIIRNLGKWIDKQLKVIAVSDTIQNLLSKIII
jgi:hypothetical protein